MDIVKDYAKHLMCIDICDMYAKRTSLTIKDGLIITSDDPIPLDFIETKYNEIYQLCAQLVFLSHNHFMEMIEFIKSALVSDACDIDITRYAYTRVLNIIMDNAIEMNVDVKCEEISNILLTLPDVQLDVVYDLFVDKHRLINDLFNS